MHTKFLAWLLSRSSLSSAVKIDLKVEFFDLLETKLFESIGNGFIGIEFFFRPILAIA